MCLALSILNAPPRDALCNDFATVSQRPRNGLATVSASHRNMNGFMFGGYLMRRALEVGWLSAFKFGGRPTSFAGLDDVVFRRPVEVGAWVHVDHAHAQP